MQWSWYSPYMLCCVHEDGQMRKYSRIAAARKKTLGVNWFWKPSQFFVPLVIGKKIKSEYQHDTNKKRTEMFTDSCQLKIDIWYKLLENLFLLLNYLLDIVIPSIIQWSIFTSSIYCFKKSLVSLCDVSPDFFRCNTNCPNVESSKIC